MKKWSLELEKAYQEFLSRGLDDLDYVELGRMRNLTQLRDEFVREALQLQGIVGKLVEMADRVVEDAGARHRQDLKGKLVYGDCYVVHHEHIYGLENVLKAKSSLKK